VLFKNTAGGPVAQQLFDLRNTAAETACLSFDLYLRDGGPGVVAQSEMDTARPACPGLSALLSSAGAARVASLVARGAGPPAAPVLSRSLRWWAAWRDVIRRLLWLGTMMAQF